MNESRHSRFDGFVFDHEHLELSRDGQPIKLQRQPAQVLATLIAHAGQPVSREQLRQAVWKDDTFVDFDGGLNFCITQIRAALGDDPGQPRFVRTLPKRGYTFVARIDEPVVPAKRTWPRAAWIAPLALGALVIAGVAFTRHASPVIVAVARFDNETGDPSLTRFSDALTDTVVERLTADGRDRYLVIGNAAMLRRDRQSRDISAIGAALHARYIVIGQLQRDDEHLRVLAHLIRLPEQTHVKVSRTEEGPTGTLATVDEIADRIVRSFDATLADSAARAASAPPAGR